MWHYSPWTDLHPENLFDAVSEFVVNFIYEQPGSLITLEAQILHKFP